MKPRAFLKTVAQLVLSLAALGCRGLAPLPAPRSLDGTSPPVTPAELWRELEANNLPPPVAESAFASTLRVVLGDLAGKKAAQRAKTACRNDPPPGFEAWRGEPVAGAAPLHAYFFRGEQRRPIVFVLHGLYDSKNTRYVRETARFLAAQGFGVLVPDLRWHGCLLSEEWLPSLGIDEARDLVAWSGFVTQREPGRPVGLLGFSLGALDLIHALAAPEAETAFRAGGIAVSPPAELARTLTALDRGTFAADRGLLRLIDRGFRDLLLVRMKDQGIRARPGREHEPFGAVLDHVLEKKFAFGSVNRSGLFLATDPAAKIRAARRPLLLLPATNDPFFGELAAESLTAAAKGNPWVHVRETPYGGHIGQVGLYPRWISTLWMRFFSWGAEVEGA